MFSQSQSNLKSDSRRFVVRQTKQLCMDRVRIRSSRLPFLNGASANSQDHSLLTNFGRCITQCRKNYSLIEL
jgi:hypothetical protein